MDSPILNTNLIEMILKIVKRRLTEIYRLAGAIGASKYEFASMIAEIFKLNRELIRLVTMNGLEWTVPRLKDLS